MSVLYKLVPIRLWYTVLKFHAVNYYILLDMNYCPVTFGQVRLRTERDAYEPTVHGAQVGSKNGFFPLFTTTDSSGY